MPDRDFQDLLVSKSAQLKQEAEALSEGNAWDTLLRSADKMDRAVRIADLWALSTRSRPSIRQPQLAPLDRSHEQPCPQQICYQVQVKVS
jgi:hypothetical protein